MSAFTKIIKGALPHTLTVLFRPKIAKVNHPSLVLTCQVTKRKIHFIQTLFVMTFLFIYFLEKKNKKTFTRIIHWI